MSTPFILPPSPATVSLDVAVVQEIFRRIDTLAADLTAQITAVDQKLDAQIASTNQKLDSHIASINMKLDSHIALTNEKLDNITTRIIILEQQVVNLEQQVGNNKDEEREATCIPAQGSFYLRILSMILPSTTDKHLNTS